MIQPMKNRVLVLGNGFDLDLGYPTGYKDYKLPFQNNGKDSHRLGKFLLHCTKVQQWGSLEKVLTEYGRVDPEKEYKDIMNMFSFPGSSIINKAFGQIFRRTSKAIRNRSKHVPGDLKDLEKLSNSLEAYIKSLDLSKPREDSVAAKLLKALCSEPSTVYSFNYTDLAEIGKALGVEVEPVHYVHGCAAQGNMVLGAGDYTQLRSNATYLYKTMNEKYRATDLMDALDKSDEVFFYGLSFSKEDYPYFEDFFKKIADGDYGSQRKYIRIFTYDDYSRMDVLSNLRGMTDGLTKLYGYADFEVIRTKDGLDEDKVAKVLEYIDS